MSLCSNRPNLPGNPSTCVIDVALVPTATWVFLLLFVLYSIHIFRSSIRRIPGTRNTSTSALPRWVGIIYAILIVAAFAMVTLEVARLIADDLGVGLLPASFVGLIVAFGMVMRKRVSRAKDSDASGPPGFILIPFWVLLVAFEAIKVVRLRELERVAPGVGSKYPASDQVLDNEVMLGLYAVFAIVEILELILSRRGKNISSIPHEGVGLMPYGDSL